MIEEDLFRRTLVACWPMLLGIGLSLLAARLLLALMRIRPSLRALRELRQDEAGGVQTLSFVLTIPLFLMILMFIVQLSQLTIGQVGVEYAAFSAARSAIVWIPADASNAEPPMRIGTALEFRGFEAYSGDVLYEAFDVRAYVEDGIVPPQVTKIIAVYRVVPGGAKFEKIRTAAVLALANVAPSRPVVTERTAASATASVLLGPMNQAFVALAPRTAANPRVPTRLAEKLVYALERTAIEIELRHKDTSAWLDEHDRSWDREQYRMNETDWQDQVTVDVIHEFALLPGPGRLLARRADARPGTDVDESYAGGAERDRIAAALLRRYGSTYVYPLRASARLTIEGFQPSQPLAQPPAATDDWWLQSGPAYESLGTATGAGT
ncbi:MAG TPA: hypothetical protein DCQ98_07215 [Planctomycetaceae bacterium]|nr:hypothetical protein [Planctomycetaceae bacterium]HRE99409.1 pilus assembly protein [Pirellulaceae bacterium]